MNINNKLIQDSINADTMFTTHSGIKLSITDLKHDSKSALDSYMSKKLKKMNMLYDVGASKGNAYVVYTRSEIKLDELLSIILGFRRDNVICEIALENVTLTSDVSIAELVLGIDSNTTGYINRVTVDGEVFDLRQLITKFSPLAIHNRVDEIEIKIFSSDTIYTMKYKDAKCVDVLALSMNYFNK